MPTVALIEPAFATGRPAMRVMTSLWRRPARSAGEPGATSALQRIELAAQAVGFAVADLTRADGAVDAAVQFGLTGADRLPAAIADLTDRGLMDRRLIGGGAAGGVAIRLGGGGQGDRSSGQSKGGNDEVPHDSLLERRAGRGDQR
mgnify:CR=1 FL=1